MYLLVDQKVAYLPVPKTACTSIKHLLFEIENGFRFTSFRICGKPYSIHDFCRAKKRKQEEIRMLASACNREKYFLFCVVRDPVERFLSCYSNRVLHHCDLVKEQKNMSMTGLNTTPCIDEYIHKFELYYQHFSSIRHHATPLVGFLGVDASLYSKIYHINDVSTRLIEDLANICKRSNLASPHLQISRKKITANELSSNQIAKIKTLYAADYSAFGKFL